MKISHDSLPQAYGYAKLNEQGDKQKGSNGIVRDNSGNARTRDTIDISGTKGAAISTQQNTYRNINDFDTSRMARFTRTTPDEAASQAETEAVETAAYKANSSTAKASAQTDTTGTTGANVKNTVDVGSLNIAKIEADLRKELEKDVDFMKKNGLEFELVLKGRVYEKVSELTGEDHVNMSADSYFKKDNIVFGNLKLPFHVPDEKNPGSYKAVDRDSDEAKAYVNKMIAERGKANDEYAKYKEMKAASPNTESAVSTASSKSTVDIGNINIAQVEDDTRKELSKDADLLKQNGLDFELVLKGRLYEIISKMTGSDYMNISADSYFKQDNVIFGNLKLPFHVPDENNSGSFKAVDRDSDEAKTYVNKMIAERGKANDEYAKYKEIKAATASTENV